MFCEVCKGSDRLGPSLEKGPLKFGQLSHGLEAEGLTANRVEV